MSKRVVCYIDGFNLYHSINSHGPGFNYLKWVNLWSLSEAFIKTSTEHIEGVYYFSAIAYWLLGAKGRHKSFITANEHFGVTSVLGNFKEKDCGCKTCGATWISHEEKQSDVNIATHLIHHAHLNLFDKALVVTADSDLCPPIQLVLDTLPGKEIEVIVPVNRYRITRELRGTVKAHRLKKKHLENNKLPDIIYDNLGGRVIKQRPQKYIKP